MNGLAPPAANSLILIGLTLRTFSTAFSVCAGPPVISLHETSATRSPLNGVGPEVTLNVAVTLAPGATGPATVAGVEATVFQPLGPERPSFTLLTGAPVVFLNVTVVSCEEPGEKVCSSG